MVSGTNTILKKQSGTALVIALIMMVVITLIALASSYTSIFEIGISGNKRGKTNAFFVADGCINQTASFAAYFISMPPNSGSSSDYYVDYAIPNPPPCSSGNIRTYPNQRGAPRGGGWGGGTTYAYFRIDCTGNDTAGSAAKSVMMEDMMRLLPTSE